MRSISAAAAILLGAFTCAQLATAEETVAWKKVGGWQVSVDRTLGFGCFIFASYERGTVLRLGFDKTKNNFYMLLGHSDWESLQVGKDYELRFQFDGSSPWKSTASAVQLGSVTALWVTTTEVDFLSEFMRKHFLVVTYNQRVVANLNLRDSAAAVTEMVECQKAINEMRANDGSSRSPNSGNAPRPSRASDPFR